MAWPALTSAVPRLRTVCARELAARVELSETEAKFLLPDLARLPRSVLDALVTGRSHPLILRRGLVLQEYLPVNKETLAEVFAAMKMLEIPFGSSSQQRDFLAPGVAKEIRFMTKSIKILDRRVEIYQVTVKGAGGVSVAQLESPEEIAPAQRRRLAELFAAHRPRNVGRLRKIYFELHATNAGEQVMRDPNGRPYSVEVDIFVDDTDYAAAPKFINGEVEFHDENLPRAITAANRWRNDPASCPPYLIPDLTDRPGFKSRDLAHRIVVPDDVGRIFAANAASNQPLASAIGSEFRRWARIP